MAIDWISKIMSWLWIGEPWYNWYTLGSLYLFGIWDLQRAIPLQLTAIPKGRLYNHLQSTDLWKHGSIMKHSKSEEIPNHPMFDDQTNQCLLIDPPTSGFNPLNILPSLPVGCHRIGSCCTPAVAEATSGPKSCGIVELICWHIKTDDETPIGRWPLNISGLRYR